MLSSASEKTYALFQNPANRKIAAQLKEAGARFFEFPASEIQSIASPANKNLLKNELAEFDWIVFPDVFAVENFLARLEESEIDLFQLDELNVLAFGEAVSDRLRFVQLHADVIPNSTADIFNFLINYIGDAKLDSLKFLFVKESEIEYSLIDKLKNSGATVEEFSVYRAQIINNDETAKLKALVKGGAVDEIIFASSEDFYTFTFYFSPPEISEIASDVKITAVGETAFQTLKENNLAPRYFQIK